MDDTTRPESTFHLEKANLPNGEVFSLPADAIPEIKKILLRVKWFQIEPDLANSQAWKKYGHSIANAANLLMMGALVGENEQTQNEKLIRVREEIILRESEDIIPLLNETGFLTDEERLAKLQRSPK